MSRRTRTLGRVLVSCVTGDDWTSPPDGLDDLVRGVRPPDLGDLPAAAASHGVPGCVPLRLRDAPRLPAELLDDLAATYHRARLTHLQALADLSGIASVLDALGVP